MALNEKEAREKVWQLREEALLNQARRAFASITVETEGYLSGERQIPEDMNRENYRAAGYRIINLEPGLADRITAMLAGRLNITMRAVDGSPSVIERMCVALFNELKRAIHFSGILFEWTNDGVCFNIGVARVYHDSAKMMERGGYIGIETPHPLTIWISPYARNPYHPLLGSDYIGCETVKTRGELKALYPELRRKIARLPRYEAQAGAEGQFDPLYPFTQPFGSTSGETEVDSKDSDEWRPTSGDEHRTSRAYSDDDKIRVIETTYEAHESVEIVEGISEDIAHYRTIMIAGDKENSVVCEPDSPSPYGVPNIVLFVYRRSRSGPYGNGGAPALIHDVQDGANTVYSQLMDELQTDAAFKQIFLARVGVFQEGDKDKFTNGSGPRIIDIDPDHQYMDDRPIRGNLVERLSDPDVDWQKKLSLLDKHIELMRTVMGVTSSVIGDMNLEKRVSGIAVATNQQATLIAQEPARQHLNAAAKNLANVLWGFVRYHWIMPQKIRLDDGQVVEINTRVPVTPETSQLVDQLLNAPNPTNPATGAPLVPGALHVPTEDGEEVYPLSDREEVERILRSNPQGAEFSFNYLPLVELDVDMNVEGDDKAKGEERRGRMTWAATLPKGAFSWETVANEALGDDEYWSPQLERKRLYGDEIAQTIAAAQEMFGTQGAQMIQQAIQQAIQAMQQQAQAQANGQPPAQGQGGQAMPPPSPPPQMALGPGGEEPPPGSMTTV